MQPVRHRPEQQLRPLQTHPPTPALATWLPVPQPPRQPRPLRRLIRVHLRPAHRPPRPLRRLTRVRLRPAPPPRQLRRLTRVHLRPAPPPRLLRRQLQRLPSRPAINLLPAAPTAVRIKLQIRAPQPALPPAELRLQPAVTRPTLLIRRLLAKRMVRICRKPRLSCPCWDCSDSAHWWLASSSAGSYNNEVAPLPRLFALRATLSLHHCAGVCRVNKYGFS
jgi:hypothetical protein